MIQGDDYNLVGVINEMRIRNFSQRTIRSYIHYITNFLKFANKSAKEVTAIDIRNYLVKLADKDISASTLNTTYSALQFYFGKFLHRRFFVNIPRAKQDKKLPVILSKAEIVKMINLLDNIKHKLMIQIMYSSGLRVSELVNLRINDIGFSRKCIFVRSAKGRKDRITVLAHTVTHNINNYLKQYQPLEYLFERPHRQAKQSTRSVQRVVEIAMERAGIGKPASAHSLRHSFAAHLIEQGTNIRYVQAMLGHASLETTQIYIRVANDKLLATEDLL